MLLKNPLVLFLSDPSLTTGVIQHIIAEFAKLNNILQQLFIVFTYSRGILTLLVPVVYTCNVVKLVALEMS